MNDQTPVFEHDDQPTMLTVAETAKVLRIGRNSAYQLVREGKLPSVRLGRTLRIPMAMLTSWIEARASGGTLS